MTQNQESRVADLRAAYEHRAAWMYLLIEEARKAGLDSGFARRAIYQCGRIHGAEKFTPTASLKEFRRQFVNPTGRDVFEMEVEEGTGEDEFVVNFHYCPLVAAWEKLTGDRQKIAELCDIAMEGDRGIASRFPFTFTLESTIAQGAPVCRLRFARQEAGTA